MNEDGSSCTTPYLLVELTGNTVTSVDIRCTTYDPQAVTQAYVDSGAARVAPEIARAALHTMCSGAPEYVLSFIRHGISIARQEQLDPGAQPVWEKADRTFPWDEPEDSRSFWQNKGVVF